MRFRAVRLARLIRHDLLGRHLADTFVDSADRLVLVHGPNVHHDLCIRNIEQLCAPCVFDAQRIVRNCKHARFRSVDDIPVAVEYHFFRLYPCKQILIRNILFLAFVKVPRKAVFQKHRRIALT